MTDPTPEITEEISKMLRELDYRMPWLYWDRTAYDWFLRIGPLSFNLVDNFGGRFTFQVFWRSVLIWTLFDRQLLRRKP